MFDNNLKFCREDLEITQRELGNILGVSDKTIANWENAYDSIPLSKLVNFCNLYNYSVDYVLGLTKRNIIYSKILKLDKTEIGKKIRDIRKELKLTQNAISNECSISRTTLTYYELGKNLISTRTLYIICKNHQLSADEILGRKKIT